MRAELRMLCVPSKTSGGNQFNQNKRMPNELETTRKPGTKNNKEKRKRRRLRVVSLNARKGFDKQSERGPALYRPALCGRKPRNPRD